MGVLLLLEGGGSVLLLDDGILSFFQRLGKLEQYGEKGSCGNNGCENFGSNTKCKGGFGWRMNMVEIRDENGKIIMDTYGIEML